MPARVSSVTACPRDRRSASLWPAPCCAGTQVLLLDEATSALDETTERQMLENLMCSGRVQTCVLITHRAATAGRCDRRYVLHGTCLCEQSEP